MEENTQKSDVALREEKILEFWREQNIFGKSLENKKNKKEFVFYEGPPTANGKPGIHHLEARAFKDAIPRYKTMRGYHVRRKGGWDTHGLPVELQVEKKLGLNSKKAIEEYGIAKFNQECKESVWEYLDVWNKFTKRIGYWVDQENPYVTYHNEYIESVWNIVKKINTQKLLYKDYKVVPWCPRCGTALSSHELAQGYEDVTDLTVTVRFELSDEPKTFLLAWTTTPWTLPGNTALAIHKDLDYIKLKRTQTEESKSRPGAKAYEDINYIVSKKFFKTNFILLNEANKNLPLREQIYIRPEYVVEQDNMFQVIDEFKGKTLIGKSYKPIFDYFLDTKLDNKENIWKIWHAKFVTDDTGTGIAHEAPAFGVDDMELSKENKIPVIKHVNPDGSFVEEVKDFPGMKVKKIDDHTSTDIEIIKWLAHNHKLFTKGKVTHSYPHCWRCHTALIYYARDSWYIRMSDPKIKKQLISENKTINWEPAYTRDGRFGEWLREIKDWAISRERYWGTPLPVWVCEKCKKQHVIGSQEDLKDKTKKSGNKYFVMRHGEAENNAQNIYSSDQKINHLTEKGRAQVMTTVKSLKNKKITKIFCSPFLRTRETAEIVAEQIGFPKDKIIYDDRLRELEFGDFSGKPVQEYWDFMKGKDWEFDTKVPGGESFEDGKRRFGDFLYDVDKKYQDETVLIISHGLSVELVPAVIEGADKKRSLEIFHSNVKNKTASLHREHEFIPLPHNDNYELDYHRPFIDEVSLVCDCGGDTLRTKEVMDVWFDSGAMPFAQDHYPFENKKWVDGKGYPADYISEAIDQTRGWFYTLHAVGVLMGRGKAYKNVICLGHLLDAKGKKMSKSIGNVVDPWEAMDKYGVDTLRLWMYSVNQPGESKNFDEKTVALLHQQVFGLLYNVLAFYELYRDRKIESDAKITSKNILDQWILARMDELVDLTTKNLDSYKLLEPIRATRDFISDLSTWYLRRSRERIKEGDNEAKHTLYFVLKTLSKLLAPFAPFAAEDIWLKLRNEKDEESVHLVEWPKAGRVDRKIIEEMKKAREIVSLGLEERQKAKIQVRQPLPKISTTAAFPNGFNVIIGDELNVKEIKYDRNLPTQIVLDINISKELKLEGNYRELLRAVQDMRKKMGLTPSDVISIAVQTDEAGKKLIQEFEVDMKKVVLASRIEFKDNVGEETKIDNLAFIIKIEK